MPFGFIENDSADEAGVVHSRIRTKRRKQPLKLVSVLSDRALGNAAVVPEPVQEFAYPLVNRPGRKWHRQSRRRHNIFLRKKAKKPDHGSYRYRRHIPDRTGRETLAPVMKKLADDPVVNLGWDDPGLGKPYCNVAGRDQPSGHGLRCVAKGRQVILVSPYEWP